MPKQILESDFFYTDISVTPSYNWLKRYVLKRSHPRALFIDAAAFLWVGYYMWFQMWQHALIAYFLGRLIGVLSVLNIDAEKMAQSMLGKIGLLHLHPINFTTQAVGLYFLLSGLWYHLGLLIILGSSLIFLGHIFGWGKVDVHFSQSS
jgi:hypothetical protein